MAGLIGMPDGTNHKIKTGSMVGMPDGTNHKLKYIIYGAADGTNKYLWKSAVEWTYAISKQSNTTIDDNNHADSIYFYSTGQGTYGGGSVTYSFPTPLVLPAGSTLDYYAKSNRYQKMIRCIITVNGTQVFSDISTGVMSGQIPYPSGITLNSVTIEIDNTDAVDNEGIGDITITPYGGKAFKLTFLNSADQ